MVWDRIPLGTRFSARSERLWGPPSLLQNEYRVFPGGKVRPRRAPDHSPPSSAVVVDEYSYTSTHTLGHTRPVTGTLYLYDRGSKTDFSPYTYSGFALSASFHYRSMIYVPCTIYHRRQLLIVSLKKHRKQRVATFRSVLCRPTALG